ncbi:MAG: hypothetical protein WBO10_14885 [Pyrinomonadaceae bacterium]
MTQKAPIFVLTLFALVCLPSQIAYSQAVTAKTPIQTAPTISMDHEASPAYPFGRLNPNAPPETKQFEFLIGEFDCDDRILNPQNGKWFDMKVLRRGAYVLDGHAIQDQNWLPLFNTSNLRVFDAKDKKWKVTYFKAPPYQTGVWEGGIEGKDIVLRQTTGKTESRLSFFDIGPDIYSWKAETVTDGKAALGWQFTCKRRR